MSRGPPSMPSSQLESDAVTLAPVETVGLLSEPIPSSAGRNANRASSYYQTGSVNALKLRRLRGNHPGSVRYKRFSLPS
jgi:hypothetical protein